MRLIKAMSAISGPLLAIVFGAAASAQDGISGLETVGKPVDGAYGFQPAATELARDIQGLDGLVNVIMGLIVGLVVGLMLFAIVRYNRRANPQPAQFTHHTAVEVAWTLVPVVILVFIGAFSLPVLFKQQEIPDADITIKATGYQWYWGYEYVDQGFGFDSFLLAREELASYGYAPDEYLLATDTARSCAGRQNDSRQCHRRGCDPCLDDPGLWREAGRGSGTDRAALVRRRARGYLFRPMLGTLRQGSRLYADHGQSGQPASL